MHDLRNKKILVVGLGISGYEAARLLSEKGAKVAVTESFDDDVIEGRVQILKDLGVVCLRLCRHIKDLHHRPARAFGRLSAASHIFLRMS